MIAMVLAGGQGGSLGVLTEKTDRSAVSFGGKYRIIDFSLSNCINSGIDTVGVITWYRSLLLNAHIGIGIPWDLDRKEGGITLLPSCEEPEDGGRHVGTAQAVQRNMSFMESFHPDYVLILPGDQIYKMDYEVMLDYHKAKGADVTMAVSPALQEETVRFGTVVTDREGNVLEFSSGNTPAGGNAAAMGIYLFNWEMLLETLEALSDVPECDFAEHVIPRCLAQGKCLAAYEFTGYRKDVATLGAYLDANMELIDIIPDLNLYEEFWRVYTKNEMIPPQYISDRSFISRSLIGDGTEVFGNVENSIIGDGVEIREGAIVRDSIVMDGAVIGAGAMLDRAIIAERVTIGDGALVGMGDYIPNRETPDVYAYGLAVVGADSTIPAGVRIGRNTVVTGKTCPEDYPDGALLGGETLRVPDRS